MSGQLPYCAAVSEEVADAAVDGLADLLGGDFRPHRPYNRPKQPNHQGRSGKQAFMGNSPKAGRKKCGKPDHKYLRISS